MIHSELEPEPDFSFAINSMSDYASEYESETDSSSALMTLHICIFFTLYLHSS